MKYNQKISAAKSGMDVKTARKYIRTNKLPNELKKVRDWRTHRDDFIEDWDFIEDLLKERPGLQCNTIMEELIRLYPSRYNMKQLRSLQRRVRDWRSQSGPNQEVIFCQRYTPGRQSQSDFTCMNSLKITICGELFPHLLYHFSLSYSGWSSVSICRSESFESLLSGYENAIYELGGVAQEHRTDNLSAAWTSYGGAVRLSENWSKVMAHYGVRATRNNAGVSHENGVIEKRHDVLKTQIDQGLILRGSRDFSSISSY